MKRVKFQSSIYLLIGLFVYSFICIFHFVTYAQQARGIEVNPSIIQLDLATDKPQTTLAYTNHTNQTVLLTFSAGNASPDTSTQLLQNNSAQDYRFGLSSWISFDSSSLVVNPGETGKETIFLDANKLSPGGHYGSILAQIQQNPGQGNVTIKSILATLLFVRTHTGKEVEKGSVTTFEPEQNLFDFPQNFLLRFTNNGDTYLTPYGIVKIYDTWGNVIGKGQLNTGSLFVLPQSLRRLEISTQPTNSIVWPGTYHATLSMHFGKINHVLSSTITFFSFGTVPILQAVIILLVAGNVYLFLRKRKLSSRT